MSDTTNGTGGFGQFSGRYRDRWAALHPKAAPAVASTPITLTDSRQRVAVEPQEVPEGTSGSVLPKTRAIEIKTIATPFGRRRIRPG
jgi:hypothetical protein